MLPALMHMKERQIEENYKGPCIMIITPYQPPKEDIHEATKTYIEACDAKVLTIYEQDDRASQIEKIKTDKYDLLIANPLRLLSIIEEDESVARYLKLVTFLIVDEYIQLRKLQIMDQVKKLVSYLSVSI